MRLDMTITFGNVLQIVSTIVIVFAAYVRIRERLVRIETQLDPLWREFERRRAPRGREG
jgi:hypothetical protein